MHALGPSPDPGTSTQKTPSRRRVAHLAAHTSGAIALVLIHVHTATESASRGHDESWRQAYGYFLKHRFQTGVDYVFTLGPFGYLFSPTYDPDLYWPNFAIQLALAIIVSLSFVALAIRARTLPGSIALYILALFVLTFAGRSGFWLTSIVAMSAVLFEPFRGRWAALLIIEATLALVALTKFGEFIVATLCVAAISLLIATQERWTRGALAAAQYIVILTGLWLLSGQHLTNFIPYIRGALDIGVAYNQTMMLEASKTEVILSGIVAALLIVALACSITGRQRELQAWIKPLLFLGLTVLIWKSGFVRQMGHATQFFAYAALAALLVDWHKITRPLLRKATASLCTAAFLIAVYATFTAERIIPLPLSEMPSFWATIAPRNAAKLLQPVKEKARLQTHRETLARLHDLPKIRQAIGDKPIDILAHLQGIILLNELNYRPRPIFQGYQAGTQKLARRNADYFESADAPEFVIAWITPIDQRFPTTEDGETLKTVLWHYEPVLREGPYELLRRISPDPGPLNPRDIQPPLRRAAAWGEWIDTNTPPDAWQILSLTIIPTTIGNLKRTAYRPPFLYMETRFTDGEIKHWRIHRGMIEDGFILNPYLLFGDEMRAAYRGAAMRSIESFRILTDPKNENLFQTDIQVELRTIAPLTAYLK